MLRPGPATAHIDVAATAPFGESPGFPRYRALVGVSWQTDRLAPPPDDESARESTPQPGRLASPAAEPLSCAGATRVALEDGAPAPGAESLSQKDHH